MQPTALGVPASSTGRKLSHTASGMSGLELLALAATSSCQELLPDDAMADRSSARCAAVNDFDVKPIRTSGTVIANNKNKKMKPVMLTENPDLSRVTHPVIVKNNMNAKSASINLRALHHLSSISRQRILRTRSVLHANYATRHLVARVRCVSTKEKRTV